MKLVKCLLKEGTSKNEIFDKATAEGLDLKKVSKYLATHPDSEESKKYNMANIILICIYLSTVALGLLGAAPLLMELPPSAILIALVFAILIPGAITYCIYKKQPVGYWIISFLMLKGIFTSFEDYEIDPVLVLVGVGFNVFLIIYAVVLKSKLFPFQNFFNTKKNDDGTAIFTKATTS